MPQGLCADTVLYAVTNPGAGPTAASVAASGDPASFRNFSQPNSGYLDGIIRQGATLGLAQVRSPLFHDAVQGIRVTPGETPSVYSLPAGVDQLIQAQDVPIVELGGGAAEVDIAALLTYYTSLTGAAARLFNWGDLAGNIQNVKPLRVAVTSSATPGAWTDTALNATENLLHANSDYAVVGYMANAALGVIGLKGTDTSNFRISGPGATSELATTEYFKHMNEKTGRPYIPVFNSANVGSTFVSVASSGVSVAAVVELICLELVNNLGA